MPPVDQHAEHGVGVIIRREERRARARAGRGRWLVATLAIGGACAVLAGLGQAWQAGGPQPLRELVVPVSAPGPAR